MYSFWCDIASKIKWLWSAESLGNRFVRIFKKPKLSTRDAKLLRKLIRRKRKDSTITWKSIIDEFPGRDLELLREHAFSRRWIKNKTDLTPDEWSKI